MGEKQSMIPTLRYIGQIRTQYQTLAECPRNIDPQGPVCKLVVEQDYSAGMTGLEKGQRILVLYWFEHVDRTDLVQKRHDTGQERGVFALRSPHRPNPIAAAVVTIEDIETNTILVRGLDCLDGTPLLDIKPALVDESVNMRCD